MHEHPPPSTALSCAVRKGIFKLPTQCGPGMHQQEVPGAVGACVCRCCCGRVASVSPHSPPRPRVSCCSLQPSTLTHSCSNQGWLSNFNRWGRLIVLARMHSAHASNDPSRARRASPCVSQRRVEMVKGQCTSPVTGSSMQGHLQEVHGLSSTEPV